MRISSNIAEAAAQKFTAADLLVATLKRLGVDVVFGHPGGAIMPVYDALTRVSLKHILVRHEQSGAFAADAWARVTGRPGVCLGTSGPGATNLVTGIANAMMDSIPMVAITGQVPTHLLGTDAFQELDIVSLTLPIVKHSWLVRDPNELAPIVEEAFHIAASGRPGPVLIDVPKDVAAATVAPVAARNFPTPEKSFDAGDIARANEAIEQAQKPLLYLGGGIALSGATESLRKFAKRTRIPSVATLKGLGSVPTEDAAFLGMLGMHGTVAANAAVEECDLLICLGARFDDRATGRLEAFAPKAKVIHVDIDSAEINKLRTADIAICGDLKPVIEALNPRPLAIDGWIQWCADKKASTRFTYDAPGTGVYAPELLKKLSEKAGDRFLVTCDVGQHQMWVAQHCRLSDPTRHLTSGGLGAMGYGLPAGIAAKLARPDQTVVTVTGDGSIMMNIQELVTLKRYGIALKIVVLDNQRLGLVRQLQELFYDENYSEIDLSDNPDFVQVAKAFGIDAFRVEHKADVDGAVERLLSAPGPCLLHVVIDPLENVWPIVPPGKANHESILGGKS